MRPRTHHLLALDFFLQNGTISFDGQSSIRRYVPLQEDFPMIFDWFARLSWWCFDHFGSSSQPCSLNDTHAWTTMSTLN